MTLKRVAEIANVSVKTASRALGGGGYVGEATRQSVLKAASQINYVPNRAARTMRTGRTGLIGLIGHGITTSPFATDIVEGLDAEITAAGAALLIANAGTQAASPFAAAQGAEGFLQEFSPDAVIQAANYHRDARELFQVTSGATVLINCFIDGADVPMFVPDDEGGAFAQARHLLDKGHRRIGLIELSKGSVAQALRRRGTEAAFAAAGVGFDPALVRSGKSDGRTVAFDMATELLCLNDAPTALICSKDEFALQALAAAARLGLRVPEDVSVIGFDDLRLLSENCCPALTTIALPYRQMGARAARAALAPDSAQPGIHRVPCRLIERASVGPPPPSRRIS